MEKSEIKKSLEFNGKNVYFVSANGNWWIAIKPICEALGVDYNRQFQNLKTDQILRQAFALQQIVAADGKMRKMVCLPEFFVYGWIFNIQSESKNLIEFKWKCYQLLYDHFHGTLTGRNNFLREKTQAEKEIEKMEAKLMETPEFKKLQELKATVANAKKAMLRLDKEYVINQLELWNTQG